MFYKKRIEALEKRVDALENTIASLIAKVNKQNNEIELLRAQLGATQKEEKPLPKPRRRRRKTNGKETTTNE